MALTYAPTINSTAGQLVSVNDDSGNPMTVRVPAVTVVGGSGGQSTAGTSADPTYTQTAALPTGTNRSGTAGTTSAQLAPANANRRGLNIQNISANTLGVNEFNGAAAIGTAGTYTLAAGATMNVRTNQQVNVIASAASSAYTATEF